MIEGFERRHLSVPARIPSRIPSGAQFMFTHSGSGWGGCDLDSGSSAELNQSGQKSKFLREQTRGARTGQPYVLILQTIWYTSLEY